MSDAGEDTYTHGHHESVLRSHRWRTIANSAAYIEPLLVSGVNLLDVGCGPGNISAEMADRVAPGRVTAIDYSADVVASAASDHQRANLAFAVGDVYALDHDDNTFDLVHAHQVLQHLSRPIDALTEMRRVCRDGGVVACRDADYASMSWYPEPPELGEWLRLYRATAQSNGADPDAGRKVHAWADAAGFSSVEGTTSTWCFSNAQDTQWWGGLWADRVLHSDMSDQMVERGFAVRSELEAISESFRAWGSHEHAWFTIVHGEIVCRS